MTILAFATNDTFTSTALVLAIVTVVAFVAHRARQPLIVAFIAVTCLSTGESLKLRHDVDAGVVDLVLQPFSDAADDAIDALMRHGE